MSLVINERFHEIGTEIVSLIASLQHHNAIYCDLTHLNLFDEIPAKNNTYA
jgi:hypothetical protein